MIDTHEANDSLAEQDASQPNTGHQEAKAPDAPTGDAKEESPEEGASEEPKKVPFRAKVAHGSKNIFSQKH